MISNLISIKNFITFLAASSLSIASFANRDVPREMLNGIEMTLPSNYHAIFEIQDKASSDYTVAAHRLTVDMLQIAESSERNGNYLQSFRMYRLTNYLFPHRGDVKDRYDRLTLKVVDYLNNHSSCNENFEVMLRELKVSRPQNFEQVSQTKCKDITETVADISPVVMTQFNSDMMTELKNSSELLERFKGLTFKKDLTPSEKKFLKANLMKAYLGSLELVSLGMLDREDGFRVQLELNQSHSSLSLNGLKNLWETLTGETFSEQKFIRENPLKVSLKFIRKDQVSTITGRLIIKDLTFFDIWLKSINFFNYSGYPTKEIALQNDPHCFRLQTENLSISLAQTHDLYFQFNTFNIKGLSESMTRNLKKIVISID